MPEDMRSVYREIIGALKNQPPLAAIFGICLLATVGFTSLTVRDGVRGDSTWTAFPAFVSTLGVALTVILLLNRERRGAQARASTAGNGRRHPSATIPPVSLGQDEALRGLIKLCNVEFRKTQSKVELDFKEVGTAAGERWAAVNLAVEYVVVAAFEGDGSPRSFKVPAVVEPRPGHPRQIEAKIKVIQMERGDIVLERSVPLREVDGGGYEIQDIPTFSMHQGESYKVIWQTSYETSLPYVEFWSTAHPLLTMEVHIRAAPHLKVRVAARCYRGLGKFETLSDEHGQRLLAYGPFLPYQGILVHADCVDGAA